MRIRSGFSALVFSTPPARPRPQQYRTQSWSAGHAGRLAGLPSLQPQGCAWSWRDLPELGSRRQLHVEDRALAERRLHPDTAAVHLYDLFGYRQSEPRSSLGLGVGAIDLVELLKDAVQLVRRDAGPSI